MRIPGALSLTLCLAVAAPAGAGPLAPLRIPAGTGIQGRDDGPLEERPAHRVRLPAFRIDATEVSNADFLLYLREQGGFATLEGMPYLGSLEIAVDAVAELERRHGAPLAELEARPDPALDPQVHARWRATLAAVEAATGVDAREGITAVELSAHRERLQREAELPVRWVTWRDARAYCRARGGRLPTEAEWERAARGSEARPWPFGDEWKNARCPIGLEGGPAPVQAHPDCQTPEGGLGFAGNVWEWTADWYDAGYYARSPTVSPTGPEGLPDGRLPAPDPAADLLRTPGQGRETTTRKVLRGGGFAAPSELHARRDARTTRRSPLAPGEAHPDVGLRCVYP